MNSFFYNPKNLPLGCKKTQSNSFSFCIPSKSAVRVFLAIMDPSSGEIKEYPLTRMQSDEALWHIELRDIDERSLYAFRIENSPHSSTSSYAADPYSTTLSTPNSFKEEPKHHHFIFSYLPQDHLFQWDGDTPLQIPEDKTIIYEVHVRSFTNHPSSQSSHPGTYLGFIEKIPYLLDLGITTVELLPIFEFNERDHPLFASTGLCNYWGYAPIHFFCPMRRYSSNMNASNELKMLVKELHKAGIEIILDVVFNHTGKEAISQLSALDAKEYYLLDNSDYHTNYSGCGNTLNANTLYSKELIIRSLRYWVEEFHIDGFRFDLASCLLRFPSGALSTQGSIIEDISKDPVLAQSKLIAEPWDASGAYNLGDFTALSPRWFEWNGEYRDAVRAFLNGDPTCKENFSQAFMGSPKKFSNPYHSINFITCHDGFSLTDLVSYKEKHNENNGENNRDGFSLNHSINFGAEGETTDENIWKARCKQKKNFILTLLLSLGTPMILSGDEYGHSGNGNNNRWCHDSPINYFLWDKKETSEELVSFWKQAIALRKRLPELFSTDTPKSFAWLNKDGQKETFLSDDLFLSVKIDVVNTKLFVVFNSSNASLAVKLPPQESDLLPFTKLVDTEHGFIEKTEATYMTEDLLPPHTVAVYKA